MEIEEGEYIRTNQGEIFKITSISCGKPISGHATIHMHNIKSHNKKIIDLIEENDYVNGEKVININGTLYVGTSALEDLALNGKVESIATHEQFKGIEYKVGG